MGNLRPCNHSPTILGNVLDEPIVDLLHSTTMRAFAAALPAVCQPCQWHATCRGGCRAAAESAYGTPTQIDPFVVLNRRDEADTCEDAGRCS
jgi:radical SAM protein with 4Fe4S-binding SPASM domain